MWKFVVRSKYRGFDEDVELKVDNRMEVSPILWWPFWEQEIEDRELLEKFYDPMASKMTMLSSLTPAEYRKVYAATRKAYENFVAGRYPDPPYIVGDAALNAARRKHFDIYMQMLESDPRLKDPPPDLPRAPET